MMAGITVLPARLTRVAPAGTRTSAARPTSPKRAPLTTNEAFSIGGRESPRMIRAPSNTVTPVAGACPKAVIDNAARPLATRSADRCMIPSRSADKVSGILGEGHADPPKVQGGANPRAPARDPRVAPLVEKSQPEASLRRRSRYFRK